MSGNKHLTELLKVCSVLPVLAILPAMADDGVKSPISATDNQILSGEYSGYVNADTEPNKNFGGAVTIDYDTVGVTVDKDTVFSNNKNQAKTAGGAIKALNGFSTGEDVEFIGNAAENPAWGGGAVYIKLANKDVASENTTVNIGEENLFQGNSAQYGGAIALEYGDLVIGDETEFVGNKAKASGDGLGGGAIAIWQDAGDRPDMHSSLTLNNVSFRENTADGAGGAIGSYDAAQINVNGGLFSKNSSASFGGAIYNRDGVLIIGTETNKSLRTHFINNSANIGGAIAIGQDGDDTNRGSADMYNVTFSGNVAQNSGGAIATDGNLNLNNAMFSGNRVVGKIAEDDLNNGNLQTGVDGGGALFLADATAGYVADLKNVRFSHNYSSSNGGAIATDAKTLNSTVELNINDSAFSGNVAQLYGGALFNTLEKTTISNSSFVGNKSTMSDGGAIYNAGTITLTGRNIFSGNVAKKTANDIHNIGSLIIAADADDKTLDVTTFASGISGNGTLTLKNGAAMDIGVAKIEQSVLDLDGTISATIIDSRSYGKLLATGSYIIGDNAKMELNVGQAGEYKIFNTGADDLLNKISVGELYTHEILTDGTLKISTKAVDTLVAEHSLSEAAAAALVGFANADDRTLAVMSLRAQDALGRGDAEYLEAEAEKTHPAGKPVTQSVASSVQNQVLSLASARMSGAPTVGRSAGDWSAGYGIWGHGLYNKSRFSGQFEGSTEGIAIGADVSLNNKFTLGVGYADNTTDVDAKSRNMDINSDTIFVYGQYKPNKWYINAALNYTMSEYEEYTTAYGVAFASTYDVNSFGGQVMSGYDFAFGLTPEAGVRYLHVAQDGYAHIGGRVTDADNDFLTGVAGVKYAFDIKSDTRVRWRPEMRVAATYDFISDDMTSTVLLPGAPAYLVNGKRLSQLGGEFGLGIKAHYNGLNVSLNYELNLHEDYTSQTGILKFRYSF